MSHPAIRAATRRADLSLSQSLKAAVREETGLSTRLTGPSRTTDLDQVPVLGAQGPEQLEVIIYQPA